MTTEGERKRVVVVEDDDDMRELIERTLQRDPAFLLEGQAVDARRAVEVVRRVQPDLIVLDHYLQGAVMGLDSAPVIKTVAPQSKVIVFTTEDMGLEAHFEPDVDAYLQKDDLARLVSVARRVLGLSAQGN